MEGTNQDYGREKVRRIKLAISTKKTVSPTSSVSSRWYAFAEYLVVRSKRKNEPNSTVDLEASE